jgi:hypothetical protein
LGEATARAAQIAALEDKCGTLDDPQETLDNWKTGKEGCTKDGQILYKDLVVAQSDFVDTHKQKLQNTRANEEPQTHPCCRENTQAYQDRARGFEWAPGICTDELTTSKPSTKPSGKRRGI